MPPKKSSQQSGVAPLEQVLIYHLSRRKSENLLSLTLAAVLLKDLRYGNNDGTLL
jgi:hypothetical protein